MFLAYSIYEQDSVKSKEMLSPINGNVISLSFGNFGYPAVLKYGSKVFKCIFFSALSSLWKGESNCIVNNSEPFS